MTLTKKQERQAKALADSLTHWDNREANAFDTVIALENDAPANGDWSVSFRAAELLTDYVSNTRSRYFQLLRHLDEVSKRHTDSVNGNFVYIADESIDAENVALPPQAIGYWAAMYSAAASAAGSRAEGYGIELNKELGYIVY